ncbi:branched-chain amino acid ABC transporter permease [Alloalcanivorax dieselolei]|nr:branched-chain amino acid ABC transporter permease [Alloalcanivorax dieselolei]
MRGLSFLIIVVALALLPVLCPDPYLLSVVAAAGIMIIAAISLNLLLGFTGQLSLGHAAFFGIGAYTSALLSLGFDVDLGFSSPLVVEPKPVWVAFIGGIVMASLFGWLLGKVAFRVRGAYFVIVTISFAQVMRMVALNWVDLTEGPMALVSIPPLNLWVPGEGVVRLVSKASTYWLVLAAGVLAYVIVANLVRSRIGRAAIALRENEVLAKSIGIPVTRCLIVFSVLSAGIAGAAGGLYAHTVRIIDPDVFLFIYTITMVIMVIAGGKGTLAGPVVGGLIFGLLPEVLRGVVAPEVQWIIYGALMILILLFMPKGIVPAFGGLLKRRKISVRRRPSATQGASS